MVVVQRIRTRLLIGGLFRGQWGARLIVVEMSTRSGRCKMLYRLCRYLAVVVFAVVLTVGFSTLMGCEKREKHVHVEKTHKDVVVDEGPVVE